MIKRHILDSLAWGSKVSGTDLLKGRGKTALDVGCAYGYALDLLEKAGYTAYGVDISRHGIVQAKATCEADFLACDVQEGLPFTDNAFDLLTCFGVIEHLSNPLAALRNMLASCRGTLICTTPNVLVEKPVKKVIRDYDETHINVRSKTAWESCISQNLSYSYLKIEPFLDASLRAADRLLFFKSFKIPYLGLDLRILIKK